MPRRRAVNELTPPFVKVSAARAWNPAFQALLFFGLIPCIAGQAPKSNKRKIKPEKNAGSASSLSCGEK
jgi:hypothetical protein